jgi:hypothetical protein
MLLWPVQQVIEEGEHVPRAGNSRTLRPNAPPDELDRSHNTECLRRADTRHCLKVFSSEIDTVAVDDWENTLRHLPNRRRSGAGAEHYRD